jgi:hypothetical protein
MVPKGDLNMTHLSYLSLSITFATSLSIAGCGGASSLPRSSVAPLSSGIDGAVQTARNLRKKDPCMRSVCIYVGNQGSSITVYRATANGNVAPVQSISGDKTGLNDVWAVAIDASHNIYAANYLGNYDSGNLTVYAAGSNGNTPPIATIDGRTSQNPMSRPSGIGVDAAGNVYASGNLSNSISVYPPGSNGQATPTQYIAGGYTGLALPDSLAVSPTGRIYVTNKASVTVYAAGSNGNVAPAQTISGSKTGIANPNAVAVDSKGRIYVSSTPNGSPSGCCITIYDKNANGNVAPIRSINGSNTQIDVPYGIAVDSKDNIYVTQAKTNSINVYAKGANGNVAPIRVITGSKTKLNGPTVSVVK